MIQADAIHEYLKENGGIYSDAVVVLKSRKLSNFYVDARILNVKDEAGNYVHSEFLAEVGELIGEHARRLGADMLVGVVTTGATLVQAAAHVSGIDASYTNPHDARPTTDVDVAGRRVLIVDDTTTTGRSFRDAVAVCRANGAEVVGALTLIRRDPKKVREAEVGLDPATQEFVSLLDLDFEVIVEDMSENGVLFTSGLPVRLNIGYAATDGWPEKYPQLTYIGEPKTK